MNAVTPSSSSSTNNNNNNQDPALAKELGWDQPPGAAAAVVTRGSNSTSGTSSVQTALSETQRIQRYEKQIAQLSRHRPSNAQHRHKIRAESLDLDAVFVAPSYPKTDEQVLFLQQALHDNFLFMDMSEGEREKFIGAMQSECAPAGTKIIQQGDMGDFFYILELGSIDFVKDDVNVGTCQAGGSFGELALLYGSPRAVSCIAATEVELWKVDRNPFRHLLARNDRDHQTAMEDLIRKVPMFKDLDKTTVSRFVKSLTPVHWKEGTRIVQKGEEGSVFYIIHEGNVKVHDIGLGDSHLDDLELGPGSWFGERALLTGEPRAANVTALNDVCTMAMDRETFEASIGPLQCLLEREMRRHSLKALPIFNNSNVTEYEIDQLVDLMQEMCYSKGEHLAETGKPYQMNLWIIRHGRLLVYSSKSDGEIFNLQPGDYFGDKSIKGDPDHISSHTATCEENLTAWVLTREQIEAVIDDIDRLGQIEEFHKSKQDKTIQLKDLKRHRMLGKGAFGKVWLVTHEKPTNGSGRPSAYALKTMSKAQILDAKLGHSVVREKELSFLLDHPFILHIVCSYQDENHLYMLLPLILGGELYSVLHKQKGKNRGLQNDAAAFYGACIIEALGHFHQRHIAYRDLKLENILVDEQGYGKIVDLGFAKVVDDKTYTLCGTPEMLAPEIIMSKGHDQAVDYWAFGVVIYELLVGHSPFYKSGSSQVDMFKRIVLVKYDIHDFVSLTAEDLIEKLLVRRQRKRLGNLAGGYLDVKRHPWFKQSGIRFKKVLRKEAAAPWIPDVKDPLDASNFDDMSFYEKERESHRKLTKEEHEVFIGF